MNQMIIVKKRAVLDCVYNHSITVLFTTYITSITVWVYYTHAEQ